MKEIKEVVSHIVIMQVLVIAELTLGVLGLKGQLLAQQWGFLVVIQRGITTIRFILVLQSAINLSFLYIV